MIKSEEDAEHGLPMVRKIVQPIREHPSPGNKKAKLTRKTDK